METAATAIDFNVKSDSNWVGVMSTRELTKPLCVRHEVCLFDSWRRHRVRDAMEHGKLDVACRLPGISRTSSPTNVACWSRLAMDGN
jgi:hypothetical protein